MPSSYLTVMTPAFLAAFAPHTQAASHAPPIFTKPAPKPVNHNTGLATEKPWGAFPLKDGGWYGLDTLRRELGWAA